MHAVRSFFRQQFVTSLRQLGTGLEQLAIRMNEFFPCFCPHLLDLYDIVFPFFFYFDETIEDSSWLQRRENLPAALSRMTHLRRISLRFLANDMMV